MPQYEVSFQLHREHSVEVTADNEHDAIKAALSECPDGYRPVSIETMTQEGPIGWSDIVGRCEGCGVFVLDSDDYRVDDDGVVLCDVCQLNS